MLMATDNSTPQLVHPDDADLYLVPALDVIAPKETDTHPEVALVIIDEVSDPAGDMMFGECELYQLVWNGAMCVCQVEPQHRQVAPVLSGLTDELWCHHTCVPGSLASQKCHPS